MVQQQGQQHMEKFEGVNLEAGNKEEDGCL